MNQQNHGYSIFLGNHMHNIPLPLSNYGPVLSPPQQSMEVIWNKAICIMSSP